MREYWATYSVRDHLAPRAFVADVMLYDRIVVPHPPDDAERARWADEGWDPDRLDRYLGILGPERSRAIPWDGYLRDQWADRMQAADSLNRDGFAATRDVLTMGLPPYVTGVQADLAFRDPEALAAGTGLRTATGGPENLQTQLATVLGRRFLVPAANAYPDDEGALRSALALTEDNAFRRMRRAFQRWQREFLEECGQLDRVSSEDDRQQIVARAAEEMEDLIADEERALRSTKIRTGTLFALTVAGSGLTFLGGGPVTPIGLAGAFITVGTYLVSNIPAGRPESPAPAAFVTSARRHFGWTPP
ncbi:hypothetical protein [Poseidonocella sp. HB161398]|uniref:hypothetical protein n=1 Tax=Poseidonocella sp. HB161398 TaxID=2320855 RepID=UPI001107CB85|nr:hypothetical protein [Poseidonocella sp. HB161398]